ncbi:hypothetical protein FOXYS1_12167 [Fusarium oxysporum]|uniref:Uncharacterized protein n=1 Tax=Fusarium oxysporum TaxID=5507 RepID=A0A8H5EE15_FUSOX|nr:hypothetical protein FOXYS1_12167 [Fusarium oxysporum]
MRLHQRNVDLFFATAPSFVASLPPAPDRDNAPVDDATLALNNSAVILRFEIIRLLDTFSIERAAIDLPEGDCSKADIALENILDMLDNLVDDSISGSQQHLCKCFSKLESLEREILRLNPALGLDGLRQVPNEVLKLISYVKPGGHAAARYRRLAQDAKQFNHAMDRVFSRRMGIIEAEATEVFHQDRNSKADDLEVDKSDLEEIHAARKLCSAAKTIAQIMTRSTCKKPHSAYINLSGFSEAKILTIMTVCHSGNKWRAVQWTSTNSHDASATTNQTLRTAICEEIRRRHRPKSILHIGVCQDGSWRTHNIPSNISATHAKPPETNLAELIFPERAQEKVNKLEKSDRLSLATRLGGSLLCLLGSPLLQNNWNSETMRCSGGDIFVSGHFHQDVSRDPTTVADNKSFILHLGVLLWELFFQQKVNITEEDEEDEEDDDDDVPLFNALSREEAAWRDKFVDAACLDIITNCLEAWCEDEADEEKLRASIHGKVFRPLREYWASYSHPRLPIISMPNKGSGDPFTHYGSADMLNAPGGTVNKSTGSGINFPGANFYGAVTFWPPSPQNPPSEHPKK